MSERRMDDKRPDRIAQDILSRIAAASPHMEDELLAERIEHELDPESVGSDLLTLSQLLGAIPLLRSRPIALDAAIDVVVQRMLAREFTPEQIETRLIEDAPEFAESIRAHMALRGMLTTALPASTNQPASQFDSLPVSFGPPLPSGQKRYELVECVGGGCEGCVYRAFDRQISTDNRPLQVAIKVLFPSETGLPTRLVDEVARVMRVRHPAVVSLLNWGQDQESSFLVYEFIEGVPLDRWAKTNPKPSSRQIAEIVRRLAEGAQAIHNTGVAHRDIKPNNLIMDRDGSVFIADFGLAEAISHGTSQRSGGSLGFAAPEQLQGTAGSTDNTVDVYALGGILYWLLTGKYPNGETVQQAQENILARNTLPEVDTSTLRRGEDTLLAIARRALSPDSAARYSSADALAIDLARWLAHEPVLPFEQSALRRASLAVRRSPMLVVACAGLVLATAVIMWSAWRLDVKDRDAEFALERHQALIDKKDKLLEKEQQRIEEASGIVRQMAQLVRRYVIRDGDTSWLAMFGALESLTTTGALAMSGIGEELIQNRIGLMNELLAQADANGTRDTVEKALWETALVYWLIRADRLDEAIAAGTTNTDRLARLVPADDPWTITAHALLRTAQLRAGSADPIADRQWLTDHREQLPREVWKLSESTLAASQSN